MVFLPVTGYDRRSLTLANPWVSVNAPPLTRQGRIING
jgi:hypothetical protein